MILIFSYFRFEISKCMLEILGIISLNSSSSARRMVMLFLVRFLKTRSILIKVIFFYFLAFTVPSPPPSMLSTRLLGDINSPVIIKFSNLMPFNAAFFPSTPLCTCHYGKLSAWSGRRLSWSLSHTSPTRRSPPWSCPRSAPPSPCLGGSSREPPPSGWRCYAWCPAWASQPGSW